MAGDWIKMRCDLWDDPRIVRLTAALEQDRPAVIGRLYRLWALADQYTEDGCLKGYTPEDLDAAVDLAGFAAALERIGWLTVRADSVSVPRFDEHNGESAKTRAQSNRRVARHRKKGA